ncbi:uncharacterized protein ACA1_396550 [Acanthamoeba castellanii str. Neff]|uniref:Uncharacterized protein n=1 Tax=Acanthamoeba castellanii (strain ATCC 30010 / Neff) TaxID=1257118 RepID=L8HBD9_ACACF|nr:uncharacterized protein ACA1_396550 [Acanthamoeba castellanii str. Neff]ELR22849.1 hypothetical protein ACA1_396550 [Acanthamoeba castellanii str. Neff]
MVVGQALTEFSGLHRALTAAGVNILLHAAERHHNTPDAVFPNNWFSTHPAAETGRSTLVFYPMKTPSRRAERRQTIVEELQAVYEQEVSFEHWENADPPRFLESTGVLILDRARKVAYAALSQRCSKRVASQWAKRLGYEMCFFHASDAQGQPIYHTNVMMAVGSSVAVVCLESVADLEERENLRRTLSVSHEVVEITRAQVDEFCGNVLEVRGTGGRRVLAMSSRAFAAFTDAQLTLCDVTWMDGWIGGSSGGVEDYVAVYAAPTDVVVGLTPPPQRVDELGADSKQRETYARGMLVFEAGYACQLLAQGNHRLLEALFWPGPAAAAFETVAWRELRELAGRGLVALPALNHYLGVAQGQLQTRPLTHTHLYHALRLLSEAGHIADHHRPPRVALPPDEVAFLLRVRDAGKLGDNATAFTLAHLTERAKAQAAAIAERKGADLPRRPDVEPLDRWLSALRLLTFLE